MKFQKKPIVVHAWECHALIDMYSSPYAWPAPLRHAYVRGEVTLLHERELPIYLDHPVNLIVGLKIRTLEGEMIAERDDWVICGVNGELYRCKPDIFEKTYEKVGEQA